MSDRYPVGHDGRPSLESSHTMSDEWTRSHGGFGEEGGSQSVGYALSLPILYILYSPVRANEMIGVPCVFFTVAQTL
jgi:hypothetical protein